MLTEPAGVSGEASYGTPTETGSHSQTKYYYIANSKLAIANKKT